MDIDKDDNRVTSYTIPEKMVECKVVGCVERQTCATCTHRRDVLPERSRRVAGVVERESRPRERNLAGLASKESGLPRIPYLHAVEEALCFGWIDGIHKRLNNFPDKTRQNKMFGVVE